MKNTLTCNITGTERVTNVPYLATKADRLGISIEDYKQYYVTKAALGNLKADVAEKGISATAKQLDETVETIQAYINFNGKNKFVSPVEETDDTSTSEDSNFVSGELTTA